VERPCLRVSAKAAGKDERIIQVLLLRELEDTHQDDQCHSWLRAREPTARIATRFIGPVMFCLDVHTNMNFSSDPLIHSPSVLASDRRTILRRRYYQPLQRLQRTPRHKTSRPTAYAC